METEESGNGRGGVEDEKGFRAWHKREQARLAQLPAFTHGLFYVGIGRATTSATIYVLCAEKDIIYDSNSQPSASIMSIVWPEMLPEHWRATHATTAAPAIGITGTAGHAVSVDESCALPAGITGDLEDDIDLE